MYYIKSTEDFFYFNIINVVHNSQKQTNEVLLSVGSEFSFSSERLSFSDGKVTQSNFFYFNFFSWPFETIITDLVFGLCNV